MVKLVAFVAWIFYDPMAAIHCYETEHVPRFLSNGERTRLFNLENCDMKTLLLIYEYNDFHEYMFRQDIYSHKEEIQNSITMIVVERIL